MPPPSEAHALSDGTARSGVRAAWECPKLEGASNSFRCSQPGVLQVWFKQLSGQTECCSPILWPQPDIRDEHCSLDGPEMQLLIWIADVTAPVTGLGTSSISSSMHFACIANGAVLKQGQDRWCLWSPFMSVCSLTVKITEL